MKENTLLLLTLINELSGVETGKYDLLEYLNLLDALSSYQPGQVFYGRSLAVRAADPSDPFSAGITATRPTYEKVTKPHVWTGVVRVLIMEVVDHVILHFYLTFSIV